MEIIGYKCFNKDLTNNYGLKFEVGKTYTTTNKVEFKKNGFHMCKRLEDTLRFFDFKNNNISICLVKGSGNIKEGIDEYYGYYEMYSVETIEIIKELTRKEIIDYAINLNTDCIKRFITCFSLTSIEISYFKEKFKNNNQIIDYIEYYQEQKLDTFKKRYKKLISSNS